MQSPESFNPQPKNVNYMRPHELKEEALPQHTFELTKDGQVIGGAELAYYSKGVPHYELASLWVDYDQQGKGHASEIMDAVEDFLRTKKRPGTVVDAILDDPDNPNAAGMYERRGWQRVPGEDFLVFNWPQDISVDKILPYGQRYPDIIDREDTSFDLT